MTPEVIRCLVKSQSWSTLGKMLKFTPVWRPDGHGKVIDKRCLPKSVKPFIKNKKKKRKEPPIDTGWDGRPGVKMLAPRQRKHFYLLQRGICHYCHQETAYEDWTIDHIVPLSKDGSNRLENKVGCCTWCNNHKGSKSVEEFTEIVSRKFEVSTLENGLRFPD